MSEVGRENKNRKLRIRIEFNHDCVYRDQLKKRRIRSILTRHALGLALHPEVSLGEMQSLAKAVGVTAGFIMLQASADYRSDFEHRLRDEFKDQRTRHGRIPDPLDNPENAEEL